jgi:hypothetical protein
MQLHAKAQLPPLAPPSTPCHSAEHRDQESAVLNLGTDGVAKTLVWGGHSCPPPLTCFCRRGRPRPCKPPVAHSNVAPFATLGSGRGRRRKAIRIREVEEHRGRARLHPRRNNPHPLVILRQRILRNAKDPNEEPALSAAEGTYATPCQGTTTAPGTTLDPLSFRGAPRRGIRCPKPRHGRGGEDARVGRTLLSATL